MPSKTYERLPTSSPSNAKGDHDSDDAEEEDPTQTPAVDSRFVRPVVSPWKRAALLIFVALLFWIAFSMRRSVHNAKKQQGVLHAKRYSKEYKFRPAASPVLTEHLKDGRVVIRGALPT